MWKFVDYINAGSKVVYDKTTDYMTYYTGLQNEENQDNISSSSINLEDKIDEYDTDLEIKKYNNEECNKRLYPHLSLWDEYAVFFGPPTHIIDNLYLGSAFNAASYDVLKDLDIRVILNITKEIRNYYDEEFEYIRCDLYDNNQQSIAKYLERAYNEIINHQNNTGGNILVHCFMGASRSASVIIYYIMKKKKKDDGTPYTFDDALEYLRQKRPIVNPTFRFTKDLARSFRQ